MKNNKFNEFISRKRRREVAVVREVMKKEAL